MSGRALAATQAKIDTARAHALAYLISHQAGDGRWISAPRLDIQTTATALLGMEAAGVSIGYPRAAALNWLDNAHAGSIDALARQAAVLGRSGRASDALFTNLTDARFEPHKGWGAYPRFQEEGVCIPRRSILSATERESLLALPDAKDELIRLYTFNDADLSRIRQHRGAANRLGFAVQLCYMRYPGITLTADAEPDAPYVWWQTSSSCRAISGTTTANAPKRDANICWSCNQPTASNHSRH